MRLLDLIPASDDAGAEADVGIAPGKATLVDQVGHADRILSSVPGRSMHTDGIAIQRRGIGQAKAGADLQRAAAEGTSGAAATLPHADRIQESFGRHDVVGIRAHVGGAAATASRELGALAYASGDSVAFASQPDLHTAAHEAAHVIQQRGGVQLLGGIDSGAGDPYEQHADRVADAVVRGESAEALLDASPRGGSAHAGAPVQRRTTVNAIPTARRDKLAVLGDSTPAHQGMTIDELNTYVAAQADWFSDPSFSAQADRDAVWGVLLYIRPPHMGVALRNLRTGPVAAAIAGADRTKLTKYATCFDTSAQTVQVSTAATTMARALQLGQAIIDLEARVPTPVLRVIIPEAGLIWLVDHAKVAELVRYYNDFSPTLETPAEWPYVQEVLTEGVAGYGILRGWIHDVHMFTARARHQLVANFGDTSRSRPVLFILLSASDWNSAFEQASNLESAIVNARNLAIVAQGPTSIGAASGLVNLAADTYGQQSRGIDWSSWPPRIVVSRGRLGQVVLAGHGSDQSVEMASSGGDAHASADNRYVSYEQHDVNSSDPVANGTQTLIDTVLSRMDPNDANVVFAGCLVGSHEFPASTDVSGGSAAAQANLQAALRAHPNLADYVRGRMTALGVTGQVQAANGSTTFGSFNVDPASGRAQLSNASDPHIAGSKLQYVQTGVEPEGALRAALECYADPAIGPSRVTTEMRTRVSGLAANTGWWETCTRVAYQLCLPPAGDVDAGKMLDIVHRVANWFFCGFPEMINVANLVNSLLPAEAPIVLAAMLTTTTATQDYLKVSVNEAWMNFDASKTTAFLTALTASALTRETFNRLLVRAVVDPKLATLLPVGAPTKGQLIVALTIAANDHNGMPAAVRTFLRAAAGGARTSTFPAALGVPALIAPLGEISILGDIDLAPTSAPVGPSAVDGNVDANHNGTNETLVTGTPREATVTAMALNVRARPNTSSAVLSVVRRGDVVRVMGETEDGWSLIDFNGRTGFVATRFVA